MAASTKVWSNDNPPQVDDVDLNGFERENNFLISSSGQSLNTSDNTQTSKGVANYVAGADFYSCSGAANSYILTASSVITGSFYVPTQYFDGMRIRFLPNISNTGTSTVNVAGLGVVSLYRADGADLEANDLSPNLPVVATYISSGFRVLNTGNNAAAGDIQNIAIGGCASSNPWQRQVTLSNAITPGSYQYVADRIYITSGANTTAQLTYSKSSDAPPISISKYFSANSFQFEVTTTQSSFPGGDDGVWAGYMVEGYDFLKLAQQNVVVSFVAKSTVPGTYSIALQNGAQTYSVVKTITLTTSYQLFVLIFPPSPSAGVWDYANGIGLNLLIALSPSSYATATLDQWQNTRAQTAAGQANLVGTNAAVLNFDQLFIAPGSVFNGYSEPTINNIYNSCQRYYQTTYDPGQYAGAIVTSGSRLLSVIPQSFDTQPMPDIYIPNRVRANNSIATFYEPLTGTANELHVPASPGTVSVGTINTYTTRIGYTVTRISGGSLLNGYILEGDYTLECELGIV